MKSLLWSASEKFLVREIIKEGTQGHVHCLSQQSLAQFTHHYVVINAIETILNNTQDDGSCGSPVQSQTVHFFTVFAHDL